MADTQASTEASRATSGRSVFRTTQWTQVLAARGDSEPARMALAELCGAYYDPVIAFLSRTGHPPAEARELAHEFFATLLQGNSLANVRREGRFRSYLLGALRHFLSHGKAREQRQKRGGGLTFVPLEDGSDTQPGSGLPDHQTLSPDAAFDRQWAMTVLGRALAELRRECAAVGRGDEFEHLKPWLTGEAQHGDQAAMAQSLGMEVSALKSAVHRLKLRFRRLVKQEIGATLTDPQGVGEEMKALFSALS